MCPLISVIIPVYQVKKYIKSCIESVLQQSYETLEILLIDDGSTDGCGELCEIYAKADKRVRVIHQLNGGLSAARNTGLKECRGEWITFVDSDDFILPDMVERLYAQAVEKEADISVCRWIDVEETSFTQTIFDAEAAKALSDMCDAIQSTVLTKENAMKKMLYQQGTDSCAWGKLYRRKLFETIRFPEGKLFEDIATVYPVLEQCDRVCFLEYKGYCYRKRGTSIMGAEFSPAKMDLIDFTDKLYEWIIQKHPELEKAAASRKVRANFTIYMQIVRKKENRVYQKRIETNIKKHRRQILGDANAKKGTKLAVLLTYFGFFLLYYLRSLSSLGKK